MRPVPAAYRVTTTYRKKGAHWSLGYHTGVDYACSIGVRVSASVGGRVDRAGWDNAYGWHVRIITKDKIAVYFCHLSRISVKVNQVVKAGADIGLTGNSGNTTGPHLHYEERVAPWKFGDDREPQYNKAGLV